MAVSPAADKRFRRSHVSPARRSWLRRSWKRAATIALGVALLLYVTTAAMVYAMSADWLAVSRIVVHGNSRLSSGEVHALLEGIIGTSMLSADLESMRERLASSPWVADAELRRVFPDAISVRLVERSAAAIGRIGGTMFLVDHAGSTIEEFGPQHEEFDLPVIDGLDVGSTGKFMVDPARARLTARLLTALESRPDLLGRISQIDVSNVRDVKVLLNGDTVLLRIGLDKFAERIQSYLDLAPRLRDRMPDIDSVDLRYDPHVYVQSHRPSRARKERS